MMTKIMPFLMQVKSAEMLLKKNYKIEQDLIDLKSEIDSTLTFEENWKQIFNKFVVPRIRETDKNLSSL